MKRKKKSKKVEGGKKKGGLLFNCTKGKEGLVEGVGQ